ncbi:MAG TPA: hypothetical protein PK413_01425 [Thermoanaerobaculia bacterium]|nr:hypothetical protein [Thermoanaerobaculia bacterium]
MIAPLRRFHRWLWVALALGLPWLLWAALEARPRPTAVAPARLSGEPSP